MKLLDRYLENKRPSLDHNDLYHTPQSSPSPPISVYNLTYTLLTTDTWLSAWACVLEVDRHIQDDNDDDTCHTEPTDADSLLFYKSHTWRANQSRQLKSLLREVMKLQTIIGDIITTKLDPT